MEDKKAKQNYLFKEIIEKNYDPEQFQERLIESKTGGDDLDNWTLAELELFVTRFQQLANKGSVS